MSNNKTKKTDTEEKKFDLENTVISINLKTLYLIALLFINIGIGIASYFNLKGKVEKIEVEVNKIQEIKDNVTKLQQSMDYTKDDIKEIREELKNKVDKK